MPKQILVVEDDPAATAVVRTALALVEHRVIAVDSLDDALERLKLWTPDVVVAGASLPTLWDTIAFCRLVRSLPRLRTARVVTLTRSRAPGVAAHLLDAGADDVLTKPVDSRRLLESVARPHVEDETRAPAGEVEPFGLAAQLMARLHELKVS